jgi:hypothetical protein
MITVIGLTQLAFLSLGIVAVKILIHAMTTPAQPSPLADFLNQNYLWLYLLPVLWIGYASLSMRRNRGVCRKPLAQLLGILLAAAIFICFGAAIMFPT